MDMALRADLCLPLHVLRLGSLPTHNQSRAHNALHKAQRNQRSARQGVTRSHVLIPAFHFVLRNHWLTAGAYRSRKVILDGCHARHTHQTPSLVEVPAICDMCTRAFFFWPDWPPATRTSDGRSHIPQQSPSMMRDAVMVLSLRCQIHSSISADPDQAPVPPHNTQA